MTHLHCADVMSISYAAGPALIPALFVAGLTGSVLHCALMCGPFVLGQLHDSAPSASRAARINAVLLTPYHAGRIGAYAVMGGTAGGLSATLRGSPYFEPLSKILLLAAATLFLLSPFIRKDPGHAGCSFKHGRRGERTSGARGAWARFLTGGALAFLPCGLLYAALAGAAASGSWSIGAAAMAAFGAGTLPALFAVGWLGAETAGKLSKFYPGAVRAAPVFSGVWLLWLAVSG